MGVKETAAFVEKSSGILGKIPECFLTPLQNCAILSTF